MGIGSHTKPNDGKTNDWITPRHILEALGPFDLDPCACDPQPWPTAKVMWTVDDDGLSRPWPEDAFVWLNPPYGKLTGPSLSRMPKHPAGGIALIFARTETQMFWEHIWKQADAIMFLNKRLWFYRPDGSRGNTNAGGPSCLIAYGSQAELRLRKSGLQGAVVRWEVQG